MSMDALLLAARNHLRTQLTANVPGSDLDRANKYIGIQFEGRPPATMADWYIALDESRVVSKERESLHEQFWIEVTITRRTGAHRRRSYDEIYTDNAKGLSLLERLVIKHLHESHTHRAAAGVLEGGGALVFKLPLMYPGRGRTQPRGADWIGSEGDETFLVRVLPFGGAVREQYLDAIA